MESYKVTPPGILVTSTHHIKELEKTSVYPVYTAPHVGESRRICPSVRQILLQRLIFYVNVLSKER